VADLNLLPSACHDGIGAPDYTAYAAEYPAHTPPYQRFAGTLTDTCAWLGVGVDRWPFTVTDLDRLPPGCSAGAELKIGDKEVCMSQAGSTHSLQRRSRLMGVGASPLPLAILDASNYLCT
jgi:hypothetical protein